MIRRKIADCGPIVQEGTREAFSIIKVAPYQDNFAYLRRYESTALGRTRRTWTMRDRERGCDRLSPSTGPSFSGFLTRNSRDLSRRRQGQNVSGMRPNTYSDSGSSYDRSTGVPDAILLVSFRSLADGLDAAAMVRMREAWTRNANARNYARRMARRG